MADQSMLGVVNHLESLMAELKDELGKAEKDAVGRAHAVVERIDARVREFRDHFESAAAAAPAAEPGAVVEQPAPKDSGSASASKSSSSK